MKVTLKQNFALYYHRNTKDKGTKSLNLAFCAGLNDHLTKSIHGVVFSNGFADFLDVSLDLFASSHMVDHLAQLFAGDVLQKKPLAQPKAFGTFT